MRKSEIRNKINALTNQINNYKNERDRYKEALSYANKLVGSIGRGTKSLSSANDSLKSGFTIKGKAVGGTQIETIKGTVSGLQGKVSGQIIPEINKKIRELDNKISSANSEINFLRNQLIYAED